MESNEALQQAHELDQFRKELDQVLNDEKILRGSLPQILFHLRELIKRMANHRKELEMLGFDVFKFNSEVTATYQRFVEEMTSSITLINIVIELIENPPNVSSGPNNNLIESKESSEPSPTLPNNNNREDPMPSSNNNSVPKLPNNCNSNEPKEPTSDLQIQPQPSSLASSKEQGNVFKLLEELIAEDTINLVNIQQDAENVKASNSDLEAKLDEASKFISQMPKLGRYLAAVLGSAFGGATAGGGAAAGAIFSSLFGGVGVFTVLSVSFPPLLVGIVASGILAVTGGSIGAIIVKIQDDKRMKKLMARIGALRTMYRTNVMLLDTIINGCQKIIQSLTNKGLNFLRRTLVGDISKIPPHIKLSIVMNLKNLAHNYTTALNDVRKFDQFTTLQRHLPDSNSANWEKDAPYCHRCKKGFNLFRHRHHCRFCKYTFCSSCSDATVEITKDVKVRACRNCSHYEDFDLDDLLANAELNRIN